MKRTDQNGSSTAEEGGRAPTAPLLQRSRTQVLTPDDEASLSQFLGQVLEMFKNEQLTRAEAVGSLAHLLLAVDRGNRSEVAIWLEYSRKLFGAKQ